MLHNYADFRICIIGHPQPILMLPTSPKTRINHVQTNFNPQTSVNQNIGIQNQQNLVSFQGLKSEI